MLIILQCILVETILNWSYMEMSVITAFSYRSLQSHAIRMARWKIHAHDECYHSFWQLWTIQKCFSSMQLCWKGVKYMHVMIIYGCIEIYTIFWQVQVANAVYFYVPQFSSISLYCLDANNTSSTVLKLICMPAIIMSLLT